MDSGIDFSYFTSAPQPYPFFGISASASAAQVQGPHVDEFGNTQHDEHFDPSFVAFESDFQYDPSTYVHQQQDPLQSASVDPTGVQARNPSVVSLHRPTPDSAQRTSTELNLDEPQLAQRSSSEEKDSLTPQQNKRKAQNRAAQRAFRERKEKHVKDLETRNVTLQHESVTLQSENERLRREIARFRAENDILKATSGPASDGPKPFEPEPDDLVGPLRYTPTDPSPRTSNSSKDGVSSNSKWAHFGTLPIIAIDDGSDESLLNAGATWDYIQAHELFRKGLVDVGDVCERLKKMARCDGQGPVFQEGDIRKAISESAVAGGRDELI